MAGRVERSARHRRRAERAHRPPLTTRDVLQPARLAVRPALAFGSGVKHMVSYWRAERRTVRQGVVALSIAAMGNVPTGILLGLLSHRLVELPGLIILIPAAIGVRGTIFGGLASRLGTSMHAGSLRFTRERDSVLGQNLVAVTTQSIAGGLYIAVAAHGFATLVGLPTIGFFALATISMVGSVAASAVVAGVTVAIAAWSQRRDWDLDAVAAPMITFIGDLVTLPALLAASLLVRHGTVTEVIGFVSIALGVVAAIAGFWSRGARARRIFRESALNIALTSVLDIFAGIVIEHRVDRFTTFPALLILLPAFMSNAGAVGSILSARLASKLHLGAIRPKLIPDRIAALDVSLAAPWTLSNFALLGIVAHLAARAVGDASPGAWTMVATALLAGTIATLGASILAYAIAVATFRIDLDPDNHGIGVVTSVMDLAGVLCLLGAMTLLGVIP
jgi:mgtE-like transporter